MSYIPTIENYITAPGHPLRQTGGRRSTFIRQNSLKLPLVSITTVVLNGSETLSKTIMSVLSQSYPNIEYIVVDGASTDGTLDVIKEFDDKIDFWISEQDDGTSDAVNKAISFARGDYVFWLSSDDWIQPDFIELAVKSFSSLSIDFVFGNMINYKTDKIFSVINGENEYAKLLMSGNPCFNFPSMVIKRKCFQKLGLLDLAFRICNDYEWTLRLHLSGGIGFYNARMTVHRKIGGITDNHPFLSALERIRVLRRHGLPTIKAAVICLPGLLRIWIGQSVNYFVRKFYR